MANTKTQKILTISKTKSEFILDWFVDEAQWKKVSEEIGLGKTAIFRYKKKLSDLKEEHGSFEALSQVFTLKQLNTVIELYNDYVEHPEKYQKKKKSKGLDLEEQEKIVNQHLSDMNMHYSESNKKENNEENKPLSIKLEDFWSDKL